MIKKKINLKKEYNWRGDVSELLVKYNVGAYCWKPKYEEHYKFINENRSSIDLWKEDLNGNLVLYEVKSRNEDYKKKPDITEKSLKVYKKALRKGYVVKLIRVCFKEDWEIEFEERKFNPKDFRKNNGGYYRRKDGRTKIN